MKQLNGVISGSRPVKVDMTSSPTTVYVRENIMESETDSGVEYIYDEKQFTFAEYAIELAAQAQADADYAIMITEG